jgi:hypothetical protein
MIGVDVAHTVAGGDATVFVVMAMNRRTAALHFMELYRSMSTARPRARSC